MSISSSSSILGLGRIDNTGSNSVRFQLAIRDHTIPYMSAALPLPILTKHSCHFQRNGHWTGQYGGSTTQVTEGSPSGSQSALLSSGSRSRRSFWPKGKDFLFSTWAFVVGKSTCLANYTTSIMHQICQFLKYHSSWPVLRPNC